MKGNWFNQSLLATALLIPAYLAIGFFDRNYQVKSDVFLVWYFLGAAITSAFFGAPSLRSLVSSPGITCIMLLIGLTVGGIANILLFRAVASAPNPGLPVAITNTASIGVFLAAALFSRWAPNYFSSAKIDVSALLGVVLTMIGISLIAKH